MLLNSCVVKQFVLIDENVDSTNDGDGGESHDDRVGDEQPSEVLDLQNSANVLFIGS